MKPQFINVGMLVLALAVQASVQDKAKPDRTIAIPSSLSEIASLGFSKRSGELLAGHTDGRLTIWNANSGKLVATIGPKGKKLKGECTWVFGRKSLAFAVEQIEDARDSDTDANTDRIYSRIVLHRQKGGHRRKLVKIADWHGLLGGVTLSRDSKLVAIAYISSENASTIRVYDTDSGRLVKTTEDVREALSAVCFSDDNQVLFAGSLDARIRIFRVSTGKQVKRLDGQRSPIHVIACIANGTIIAAGGRGPLDRRLGPYGEVRSWNIKAGKPVRRFTGHTSAVTAVKLTDKGKQMITVGEDGTVRVWNVASGKELASQKTNAPTPQIAVDSEGKTVAFTTLYRISIWDIRSLTK